jgi:hypothetical protein
MNASQCLCVSELAGKNKAPLYTRTQGGNEQVLWEEFPPGPCMCSAAAMSAIYLCICSAMCWRAGCRCCAAGVCRDNMRQHEDLNIKRGCAQLAVFYIMIMGVL